MSRTPKKHDDSALVVDASAIHPFLFSVAEGDISAYTLNGFVNEVHVSSFIPTQNVSEFSPSYQSQTSLFDKSIATSNELMVDTIYLSHTGIFSVTGCIQEDLPSFQLLKADSTSTAQTQLWQKSPHYQTLSPQDRYNLSLAKQLDDKYSNIAVLANDYPLRVQCELEGIPVFGSSALLAAMVESKKINGQKGTYIYSTWLKKDPKWIPSACGQKMRFQEVLRLERIKRESMKSFWIPQ